MQSAQTILEQIGYFDAGRHFMSLSLTPDQLAVINDVMCEVPCEGRVEQALTTALRQWLAGRKAVKPAI